jgi:hypothetical protein
VSQYPPNPNYNPYEQRQNDPNATPGTSYGGNPPSGSGGQSYNPYPGNPPLGPGGQPNPYPGNPPSGPYGPYPANPTPPPPAGAPNTAYDPYDPYSPTYVSGSSNPAYGGYQAPPPPAYPAQQAYQGAPPPLPTPPPPARRKGPSTMVLVLAVVALIVIVGGILIGFFTINGHNTSVAATATAEANATATAHANATATADAALTATAIATTFPFSNQQVLNDPLSDNSKGFGWQIGTYCQFSGSAYHVFDPQTNTFSECFGTNTHFADFTFEAEMVISKGDGGGLLFRGNAQNGKLYRVSFYTSGHYGVYIYVDNTGTNARILTYNTLPAGVDLTNTNTVAVVARGPTLGIYLNQQLLTTVTDSTYSSGQIGFSAYDVTNPTEVIFSNAKVWQLP